MNNLPTNILHANTLPSNIKQTVALALAEDLGGGDITANLIPDNAVAQATVICRDQAVIAGQAWFNETFQQVDDSCNIEWFIKDGDFVKENTILCQIEGNARSLLTAERSALNWLQTLSATATQTRRYVEAIAHTSTKVLDTRKTIPGLRDAQKYAVLCGGGTNHRIGLYDGILIKENHIMAAGSIFNAVNQAKKNIQPVHNNNKLAVKIPIEVEVENLDELAQALEAGADIVLLDNMNNSTLKEAVKINQATATSQTTATKKTKAKLEASGGVTLDAISAIAETGVDFISTGDLTKNIQAIDLSMRFNHK